MLPGDLVGSGTISGSTDDALGSMLELSWRGERPLSLPTDGPKAIVRTFLADGDTVTMTGYSTSSAGYRIGFGEVVGKILPVNSKNSVNCPVVPSRVGLPTGRGIFNIRLTTGSDYGHCPYSSLLRARGLSFESVHSADKEVQLSYSGVDGVEHSITDPASIFQLIDFASGLAANTLVEQNGVLETLHLKEV